MEVLGIFGGEDEEVGLEVVGSQAGGVGDEVMAREETGFVCRRGGLFGDLGPDRGISLSVGDAAHFQGVDELQMSIDEVR